MSADQSDLFTAPLSVKLRLTLSQRAAVRADLAEWRKRPAIWDHTERPSVLLSDSHKLRAMGPEWLAGAIEYRAAFYRWRATGSTRIAEQSR